MEFEFSKKFSKNNIIDDLYCHFLFEKDKSLQQIIHSIKYSGKFANGIFLGKLLGNGIKHHKPSWHSDGIIPIPLHNIKKIERGYNQSLYIAKGVSKILGIPVLSKLIKRKKYTESQTKMNLIEREANISDAFSFIDSKNINDKSFILLDDVITTGATISECGRILKLKGAKRIFAASVALTN
jgi:ComF family protein